MAASLLPEGFTSPKDVQGREGSFISKHLFISYIQYEKTSLSYCLKSSKSSQALDLSWYLDVHVESSEKIGGSPVAFYGAVESSVLRKRTDVMRIL